MNNALTISGLTKTYKDFVLDKVSFSVPEGSIVGLIGENGAGKSTTINAALGLIQKDAGYISIMGKEELDNDTKEQIGVVFDGSNYPEILSPKRLNRQQSPVTGKCHHRQPLNATGSYHKMSQVSHLLYLLFGCVAPDRSSSI